jgi:peptidoglycan/LPS O-acetylase OafA/YrhL
MVFNEAPFFGTHVQHLPGWLPIVITPFQVGLMGVPVFFVISGFCIHLPQALNSQRPFSARTYLWRRAWRLYPPYLFALVGAVGLAVVGPYLLRWDRLPPALVPWWYATNVPQGYALVCLTTQQSQMPAWAEWNWAYNVSLWSLGTEAQLYVAYLVLRPLARTFGFDRIAWLAAPIGLLWSVSGPANWQWGAGWFWAYKTCLLGHLFSWCLGAHLANCYASAGNLAQHVAAWRAIGAAAAVLVCTSIFLPPVDWALDAVRGMVVAVAAAAVLWHLITREQNVGRRPGAIGSRLRWVGLRSYSVYLWHAPIIRVMTMAYIVFLPDLGGDYPRCIVACILAGIVSVSIGLIAFELVERHFLKPCPIRLTRRKIPRPTTVCSEASAPADLPLAQAPVPVASSAEPLRTC